MTNVIDSYAASQRCKRIRELTAEAMAHDSKSREYRNAGSPALYDFAWHHEEQAMDCRDEADRLMALLPKQMQGLFHRD